MFISNVLDLTFHKIKSNLANILTLTNVALGSCSIIFSVKGELLLALIFIFVAALADRYDGMVARKLNIESEFGRQLDSLCDLLSFGVAPAILLYQLVIVEFNAAGIIVIVLYISAGAYRLARFNVSEQNGFFQGLPITAAGCLLTISYFFYAFVSPAFYMFLIIVLSICMVSTFSLRKV
ncbi:CDP-diacylglycerol--serine O-phosphatidyltransferase [Mangrovibacillus cuniculi]|uniref:CDP-diacylglycerol--serine O-phosphatidyltransferase n=1 Tax=Mangrovibacillus cuniculi TaxID=2593652 RepID=A0A7S8CBN1_9BACI|nr:CDP-diacylglycerol--serine O-phosphatidyltransferase [Mangrovibacillus cuniculi]QPC46962.1 CDP-diacylglycerol--serine O-phosphatidyltransferase [Mangrovibacillus cuniculi]